VADGADGTRDVGAVALVVHRVGVVVDEVVAVDVIHVAVVVVVDAVAGDLARVGPDVGGQVGVGVVHAGVEDGDDHTTGAGGDVPRLGGVDVGVRGAAGLPGVVQAPHRGEVRVVGDLVDVQGVVGRRAQHERAGRVGGEGLLDADAGRQVDLPQAGHQ